MPMIVFAKVSCSQKFSVILKQGCGQDGSSLQEKLQCFCNGIQNFHLPVWRVLLQDMQVLFQGRCCKVPVLQHEDKAQYTRQKQKSSRHPKNRLSRYG